MKDVSTELTQQVAAGQLLLARQRAIVLKLQTAGSPQSVLAESVLAQLEISQERQAALRDCWAEIGAQSYSPREAQTLRTCVSDDVAMAALERETTADCVASISPSGTFLRHAQFDLTDHMQAALLDLSSLKVAQSEHASDDLPVLEAVRSSLTAMKLLIHDLRFTSRAGRDVPLSMGIHCVVHLVQDACKTIQPIARAAGIQLDISSIDNNVAVRGDRKALLQVLENLLVAAIGSAPACGSIGISARVQCGNIYFSLSPSTSKNDLLAPRETVSTTRDDLSANLSAWIAEQIVEAHGGRLWTERSEPEVTSVHFTIPSAPSFE